MLTILLLYYTDKKINGHLILLQMVPVQPYWRSLGSAAHLGAETLDKVS